MAAFYLLGGGAAFSALALCLAPDRRCAVLGLLLALSSLAGLHLLLGADLLALAELLCCLLGAAALRPLHALVSRKLSAIAIIACAIGIGALSTARDPVLTAPPLRHLWLVGALCLGGLFAALGSGQLRLFIGMQVLLGTASLHCLALARHVSGPGPLPLVTGFVSALLLAQLLLWGVFLQRLRQRDR